MKIYTHPMYSFVTIVEMPKDEISMIDMDLCAQPKQTLKAYYDDCEVKPTIICNGGFFAMNNGNTVFTYADDGVIISSDSQTEEGIGILNGELTFGNIKEHRFTDFIGGYPVLIKDGKKTVIDIAQEINYNARRTILAYNDKYVYIIAVEKPGLNFSRIQGLLQGLAVKYAINLDGGGSTKVLHNGKCITKDWGNRAVDNVVAFYIKPKVLYRVQLGAFSTKCRADKFLKEIQSLNSAVGMNYSKAYVRKVGSYYKVQVGAFSNKVNAVKVVNDLKTLGYNSFITTK